jgi:hypothetical protein
MDVRGRRGSGHQKTQGPFYANIKAHITHKNPFEKTFSVLRLFAPCFKLRNKNFRAGFFMRSGEVMLLIKALR